MATYTADEVREAGNLISVQDLTDIVGATEPVTSKSFEVGPHVKFEIADDWNEHVDEIGSDDPVNATVLIGPAGEEQTEVQLSKSALLEATSLAHMDKNLVRLTPGKMSEQIVNHFLQGKGDLKAGKPLQVLRTGPDQTGVAVIRDTLTPFSNVRLIEAAVGAIEEKYGKGTEILVDSKVHHTLARTDARLIIPGHERIIESERHSEDNPDRWSAGVHLHNALNGVDQTAVDAYLFAWWCTNGCITEHANSGTWSRKSRGQDESDVYRWAELSVNAALEGMEHEFDAIDALREIELQGDVETVLQDLYSTYSIPTTARESINSAMMESRDLTSYGVMQAVTQAANNPALPPKHADRLMRVGGLLARAGHDLCGECHRLKLA